MTLPIASPPSRAPGAATDTSRLATRENLDAAGERFEAIFVGMMLKSMRAPHLAQGLLDTKAGEQFRDMQDGRLAQSMAASTPLGIGRAMTEFLGRSGQLSDAQASGDAGR